ncbi:MAG TPA: MFS transporter [Candidatus Saccharimonadales bacterium]|nr:MFS transporter [Candidatus Saccharimonadales bacterium]
MYKQNKSRKWWGLAIVLLAAFMDILDTTIVNVAVPSVQRNLHMTYAAVQWVTAGYILAFSLFLITGGRLGDIYGRKRAFIVGIAGFTLASLLSGVAPNAGVLIAARLLQGAMAAIMVPQILATIQVNFLEAERGKVLALYSAITGLASVAGPLFGGLLIKANLFGWDWRTIFLVNVPIGIIGIVGALITLDNSRSSKKTKLDMLGVTLVTGAMLLLVYPLVQGRELGWPLWTYIAMASSVGVFSLFIWYERLRNNTQQTPLILFSPFRLRSFWGGLVTIWTFGAGISSFLLMFSIWMQAGLGFSAVHAGLTFLPFTVGIGMAAGIAGSKYANHLTRRVLHSGTSLIIAGLLVLIFTLRHYGASTTTWEVTPALLMYGAGFGLVIVSLFNFILTGLKPNEAGSASGLVNTLQQLGGAVGIAIIGVIFFGFIGSLSTQNASLYAPDIRDNLRSQHIPEIALEPIVDSFQTCFHDRSTEKNPTAIPASCTPATETNSPLAAHVQDLLTRTGVIANKQNLTDAFSRTLWVEIGIYVLMFNAISLLPGRAHKPEGVMAL